MSRLHSPTQLAKFQSKLQQRAESLVREIKDALLASNNDQFIQLAGRVHDIGDESVADLLTDLNFITVNHLIKELRSVEKALDRIKNGYFGICVDCESEIPMERLEVEPTAIRCVDCQTDFERRSDRLSRS